MENISRKRKTILARLYLNGARKRTGALNGCVGQHREQRIHGVWVELCVPYTLHSMQTPAE